MRSSLGIPRPRSNLCVDQKGSDMLHGALRYENRRLFGRLKGNSFAAVDPKLALDVYISNPSTYLFWSGPLIL
jgi:hypothetical protein